MKKSILIIFVLVGIGSLVVFTFAEKRKERLLEQEKERPIKAPSRVLLQDDEVIIYVDTDTQAKSGIVSRNLSVTSYQEEQKAYGTVLQLQDLFDLRNQYIEAKAHLKKIQVNRTVAHKEYERLKILNESDKNISDKAFQSAEAAWRSHEAEAGVAQETVRILKTKIRQQWGDMIAQWLLKGTPSLTRLIQSKDVLIQITLPADMYISSIPKTVTIQIPDAEFVTARLVSLSPRTDPRIQGTSLFYCTSASTLHILPGMNVLAYLPVGPQVQGVIIPSSAVVWWQGRAWAFVQKDPERFVRREIVTENPVDNGWFLTKGFTKEDRIVLIGAQLLLSEEFRSQIHVGEE